MKRVFSAAGACLALLSLAASAPPKLPLRGWRITSQVFLTSPGWQLRAQQAAVMAEFELRTVERETAQRDGTSLRITAYRFADSYGAFGAFTYLRHSGFRPLALALAPRTFAVSGGSEIIFAEGEWLTSVSAAQQGPASIAAARLLAHELAPADGAPTLLPTVAYQLPRAGLVPSSRSYAEGPLAFAAACSWLPPSLVGFDRGAEVAIGDYPSGVSVAVISYPTPQIAATHFGALAAAPGVRARRSDSLVALVHGADRATASPLLNAVKYEANFNFVPPVPVGIDALPGMLLSVFLLCGLIFAIAIVTGILAGGLHILLHRVLPQRYPRFQQENLIQLHLHENFPEALASQRK